MQSNTTIYFIRHAHSVYTIDELNRPLSKKGMMDARRVAKRMELESVDVVVSSPLRERYKR